MANTSGVATNGIYNTYTTGLIPIIQHAIPSYTYTGATGFQSIMAVNIPPLDQFGFGPDSEIIIWASWSCNSSAGLKQLAFNFGGTGTQGEPWTDSQTTNISNEWCVRISNRGTTSSQVWSAQQNLQPTSVAFATSSLDFTQPQYLNWTGNLAVSTDSMRLERYSIWISNPVMATKGQRMLNGTKLFYGANAHYDDIVPGGGSITTAQTVSALQQLGCTMLRMTYENTPTSLNSLATMAQALQGTGIQMYCCLDLPLTSDGTNFWASESLAYSVGFSTASTVVSRLKPLGVQFFECGNEMDTKNGMNINTDQGTFPSSFSVAKWPIFRGVIHGAVAAVQMLGAYAASNAFTVNSIGASDMLWNGTAPDGSIGYPQVRWDITAFHNYQPYGSLAWIERYTSGPWMNTLDYISKAYNRPIYISEFNGSSSNTQAQNLTWTNKIMYEYYANRYRWNIMGINVYQLFQGNPWGQVLTPGTPGTLSVQGTGVQSFITSNPDTGT